MEGTWVTISEINTLKHITYKRASQILRIYVYHLQYMISISSAFSVVLHKRLGTEKGLGKEMPPECTMIAGNTDRRQKSIKKKKIRRPVREHQTSVWLAITTELQHRSVTFYSSTLHPLFKNGIGKTLSKMA